MPLALGDVSTERAQLVVFDESSEAQAKEAEAQIARLKRRGFRVARRQPGAVRLVPPKRKPHQGVFRVISDNGDDRIVWDRRVAGQVRDAFQKFKDFIARGYRAYATYADGRKGPQIQDFDPSLEEVLLVPASHPG